MIPKKEILPENPEILFRKKKKSTKISLGDVPKEAITENSGLIPEENGKSGKISPSPENPRKNLSLENVGESEKPMEKQNSVIGLHKKKKVEIEDIYMTCIMDTEEGSGTTEKKRGTGSVSDPQTSAPPKIIIDASYQTARDLQTTGTGLPGVTNRSQKGDKSARDSGSKEKDDLQRRDSKLYFNPRISQKKHTARKSNSPVVPTKRVPTNTKHQKSLSATPKQTPQSAGMFTFRDIPAVGKSQNEFAEKIAAVFCKELVSFREEWGALEDDTKNRILEEVAALISASMAQQFGALPIRNSYKVGKSQQKKPKRAQRDSRNTDSIDEELFDLMNIENQADLSVVYTKQKTQKNSSFGFRQKERGAIRSLRITDPKELEEIGTAFNIIKIHDYALEAIRALLAIFLHFEEYYKINLGPLKTDKKEKKERKLKLKEHKEKSEVLHKAVYSSIEQLFNVLQEPFETISSSKIINERHSFYKAFSRSQSQIKLLEKGKPLMVDQELYHTGRYSRLIQKNLLITIHRKTTSLSFSVSQILTDLGQITSVNTETDLSCLLHFFSLVNLVYKITSHVLSIIETVYYLETLSETEKKEKKKEKIVFKWNQERENRATEILKTNVDQDQPGDLADLVIRLTPPIGFTPDHDFSSAFIMNCRRFCTAEELIECLIDRYHSVQTVFSDLDTAEAVKRVVLKRVLNVIQKWIKTNYFLVDEGVAVLLRHFVEKYLSKEKALATNISDIPPSVGNEVFELPKDLERKPMDLIPTWISAVPHQVVLVCDEDTIAKQLTIIEWNIFIRITEVELQGQAWNKEKSVCLAQNVSELIQRANHVSFWVATCILGQERVKDQAKLITSFIGIAKMLRSFHNYNTLMSIIGGLNLSPIHRLKNAFGLVKKSVMEEWQQLMELMNPANSFKKFRAALEVCGSTALPYIGMSLLDLTFMEDGNSDEVKSPIEGDDRMLINFPKHYMIYKTIDQLQRFQLNAKWNFEKEDPVYTFLYELPILDEQELYQLSLVREPRAQQQN